MFALFQNFNLPPDSLVANVHELTTTSGLLLSIVSMFVVCVLIYRYRSILHKVWNDG